MPFNRFLVTTLAVLLAAGSSLPLMAQTAAAPADTASKSSKTAKSTAKPAQKKVQKTQASKKTTQKAASKTAQKAKPKAGAKAVAKPLPVKAPAGHDVSLLDGQLRFTLKSAYKATAIDEGNAKGTMYLEEASRRAIIVNQMPAPDGQPHSANDGAFLHDAVEDFALQQAKALPDFERTGEQERRVDGVLVKQLDSRATLGGGKTLSSTLISAAGTQMAVVQVISRVSDVAGHQAAVKSLMGGR